MGNLMPEERRVAEYRILALGDIVGREATDRVCRAIGRIKNEYRADLVIANGENAAQGNGLDRATAELLLSSGIDVLTSGNHIWQKHEMQDFIDRNRFVLRPANYPKGTPGNGCVIYDSCGVRVLVMNVLGTVFMEPLACPFEAVEAMLAEHKGEYNLSFLDIHAEATSEKLAIAYHFDGRISAVCGTHTHVQTSDARMLPKGTGYITDLGMCGAENSVLGVSKECVIYKLRTHMPVRFENPVGAVTLLEGALYTCDTSSGKALSVEAFRQRL